LEVVNVLEAGDRSLQSGGGRVPVSMAFSPSSSGPRRRFRYVHRDVIAVET
jgi:hypothetical protein